MTMWQKYLSPHSVDEVLSLLGDSAGTARLIAGGTDLLIEIQQGRQAAPECMIDISGIPELLAAEQRPDGFFLGAGVTHAQIAAHPALLRGAACLVQACGLIGGPQVRNVATIGGNVAHALPAADGSIALLALEAEAQIAGPQGRSWRPIESLYSGPGQPAFDPRREMLVGFRFQLAGPHQHSAFERVMRPQGVAIAILNMAVWVDLDDRGICCQVRIAIGPAGPRPARARQTENFLKGKPLLPEVLELAVPPLLEETSMRTSPYRASAEYRHHLAGVLLRRTMARALPPQPA
jgi:CO/xanthine dehydrogenase FAD-binding subunit